MDNVATILRERLGLAEPMQVDVQRGDVETFDGFDRERIEYRGLEDDVIPAFLFTPTGRAARGGVVVFHQHNGEFHFGKGEVAGIVGDAFQAFGPALARRGLAVLAPDAITFEDRRAADRDRGWWLGLLITGTVLAAGPLVALAYGLGVVPRFRQGVNDAFRR